MKERSQHVVKTHIALRSWEYKCDDIVMNRNVVIVSSLELVFVASLNHPDTRYSLRFLCVSGVKAESLIHQASTRFTPRISSRGPHSLHNLLSTIWSIVPDTPPTENDRRRRRSTSSGKDKRKIDHRKGVQTRARWSCPSDQEEEQGKRTATRRRASDSPFPKHRLNQSASSNKKKGNAKRKS
jgi:hypothetical protein